MTKKIGGFRNPIIHPNSEIFINFLDEPKEPFFKRLGEGISNSLDKVLQISTLATTTLTTFFLINNLKD